MTESTSAPSSHHALPTWVSITIWIILGTSMVRIISLCCRLTVLKVNSFHNLHLTTDHVQQSITHNLGISLPVLPHWLALYSRNCSHTSPFANDHPFAWRGEGISYMEWLYVPYYADVGMLCNLSDMWQYGI